VVLDRRAAHGAHRKVVQRTAGERADERHDLRQAIACETFADPFGDGAAFDGGRLEHRGDPLLPDADARGEHEARPRLVEALAVRRMSVRACSAGSNSGDESLSVSTSRRSLSVSISSKSERNISSRMVSARRFSSRALLIVYSELFFSVFASLFASDLLSDFSD